MRPGQSFSAVPSKLPTRKGQPSFLKVRSPSSPDQLKTLSFVPAAANVSRAERVSGRS